MTHPPIPDEVKQVAREPTDADLAVDVMGAAYFLEQLPSKTGKMLAETLRLAARRLEARGEISETVLERASAAGFEAYRHSSALPWRELPKKSKEWWRSIFRAALEAALNDEDGAS